jgi:glyoxylase-like metal-dependent hydrolase (beta-lactamase superfamily II)
MRKINLLVLALAALTACSPEELAVRGLLNNANRYFALREGSSFTQLAPAVFSYQKGFDRNLVVRTRQGLIVVDPFNPEFARELAAELDRRFPGEPVHTLFYSHYHLDHVRGGGLLGPGHVVGHAKLRKYWQFLEPDDILPLTRTIQGDLSLEIGGVRIELLDMGLSHSDTLYAFYLPEAKLLFAPDLGFVRAVPPAGMPDMYHFGYVAALDRLATLDFEIYVPSHFDTGTKQNLIEYIDFVRESRRLVMDAFRAHGPIAEDGAPAKYFEAVYVPLRKRYGHWLGFSEMAAPLMLRNFAGAYLGY